MDTLNLYDILENIGKKLYQNDNTAWLELQEVLPQLNTFISEAVQISEGMKRTVLSVFPQLLEAIENTDQLLTADTVYYEICDIIAVYEKMSNNRQITLHEKANLDTSNIDTNKIFENNMKCLKEQPNDYYKKLEVYCRQFDLSDEEIAVDEYGNIAILKEDRWWRVNSFYNSKYAAEFASEEIKKQNYISCLYVFGMGNFDTLRTLAKIVPSDTIVFIYEPNPKIFAVNSYYHDWSDVVSKKNVLLFVEGLNEQELIRCTFDRMENVAFLHSYVYIQPEYGRIYAAEISEKIVECKKMIRNAVYTDNTIDKYAKIFNYNRIMNLPYIYKSILISDMKKYFEQKVDMENAVAVLVAAGPSLDDNIEYLKHIKGKAFILAVDSAIRMCEEHHIKPDGFATIDPQKQEVLFENQTADETPLFWCLLSVYKQVRKLKGTKIFCNCDSCVPKDIADKVEYISPGGSVANMVLSILNYLGFHKIIAIGLDLAFLKDKKHASVVYDDGGINEAEKDDYTEVKGQNGETLLTYVNFMPYKEDVEKRIKDRKEDLTFINSSKGVYIEGAVHMSFEEAIKKFVPDVNNDFKRLIEECQKSFTLEQPSIIIEEYIQECELIYQNYEKCYHLYDKLKKIDNINDSKEIMKKIDELYMTSERSFSGTLITDASSMDADQILEEMYSGITNKEKYSKEDLNSIADKGMQIAEIFMKNARETKELFEESLKGL